MAEVLCVYREVQVLKSAAGRRRNRRSRRDRLYDEKLNPGHATTAPDLPPVLGRHASSRDGVQTHGTLSLLAGIDLLTGKVHAVGSATRREFIEFLRFYAAYPLAPRSS